ncbi:unnamed protein product [Mytilus coruscus]|uniref:Uncharacterized protein n=1 Tax=Mytilus coruscus TaxID=42192 RepID=A0A6J8EQR4_MYTCO|nr:unnamed protein product [Mytilus coruscus]
MKTDYEHRIAAVKQDFTAKMKNREHDYGQQYDNLAKRHREEMEEMINKFSERELKLNQFIEERDKQMKKLQITMKTETEDKTKLQEMTEKWSLPKETPSMKIAETKNKPSWQTKKKYTDRTRQRQLQDLRQLPEEPFDEYAERTQDLATDGFPRTPDDFIQIVATDAFLKGCLDKKAALTAMDKDPDSLDKALKYVKSDVTNQKVI